MIESRPDWCISRQRNWGVPIVAFYCQKCGQVLATPELAERVSALFEREGADAWFVTPARELLPQGTRCSGCGGSEFRKEEDILDVWFDSGISHAAVLERRPDLHWPADLYLEGSDQHRGWFHTSLLTAMVTRGEAPYRAVLTHGFTVDAQGRKMSKSLGTGLSPQDLVQRHGAEILRLWVAAEDYRDDVRISEEIVHRMVEAFRRIRNTARFLIANLYDFVPSRDRVPDGDLFEIDRWILDRTKRLALRLRRAYLEYEFHVVFHGLNNFCSVDLSALYLDIVKDRLYCSRPTERARRSAQTALWRILDTLVRLMAPILSFTAEEIWRYLPADGERPESPLLADFPEPDPSSFDEELAKTWERLLEIRSAVTKALEGARQRGLIGHSLDALVRLGFDSESELGRLLQARLPELPELFIVSQVEVATDLGPDCESPVVAGLRVAVEKARGRKCARCWNYRVSVGSSPANPELCSRCAEVVADAG
jgi:isoleucyl-tRNA synthetase